MKWKELFPLIRSLSVRLFSTCLRGLAEEPRRKEKIRHLFFQLTCTRRKSSSGFWRELACSSHLLSTQKQYYNAIIILRVISSNSVPMSPGQSSDPHNYPVYVITRSVSPASWSDLRHLISICATLYEINEWSVLLFCRRQKETEMVKMLR